MPGDGPPRGWDRDSPLPEERTMHWGKIGDEPARGKEWQQPWHWVSGEVGVSAQGWHWQYLFPSHTAS